MPVFRLDLSPPPVDPPFLLDEPIQYYWDLDTDTDHIEGLQHAKDLPMWAIDLGASVGGHWLPLIRKDPGNVARVLTKIRLSERNIAPVQQYLFIVDFFTWFEAQSPGARTHFVAILESGLSVLLGKMLLDSSRIDPAQYTAIASRSRFVAVIIVLLSMLGEEAEAQLFPDVRERDRDPLHLARLSNKLNNCMTATFKQLPLASSSLEGILEGARIISDWSTSDDFQASIRPEQGWVSH
ncbi:hypothetical protein K474DRAFT_1499297 [Panus rudis PR-1116 ss-1]|nr:hypothetical protein K474DRAFT_1499297 [Panus rudis PR-1116 ss-1]